MLQQAAESPAYHLYSPAPKQLSSFKLNACVCVCCDICQAVPAAPGIVQNVMTGEQLKQQVASQQLWPTVQQTGMFQSQDAAGSSVYCIASKLELVENNEVKFGCSYDTDHAFCYFC